MHYYVAKAQRSWRDVIPTRRAVNPRDQAKPPLVPLTPIQSRQLAIRDAYADAHARMRADATRILALCTVRGSTYTLPDSGHPDLDGIPNLAQLFIRLGMHRKGPRREGPERFVNKRMRRQYFSAYTGTNLPETINALWPV